MRLADAHIHLFANGYPGRYGALHPKGREIEVYEAFRAEHAIDFALVVGYEGDPWARGNNRYIARLAESRPWLIPLAYVPAEAPPSAAGLLQLSRFGFRGLSLYLSDQANLRDFLAWPRETLLALNRQRAILSLNVPLPLLTALRPVISRLSTTRVLLSHFGMPETVPARTTLASARKLLAPALQLADLPHVGVKLSGFYACCDFPHSGLPALFEALDAAYSARRLFWGSDFPPALDKVTFEQAILGARSSLWSPEQEKAIFSTNLRQAIARVALPSLKT